MKKTLFMCALGLTVATSMVAGTMAIYTHTTDKISTNDMDARAKKFFIDANAKEETVPANIMLAPGQFADWDFEVTNIDTKHNNWVSETNTDMTITVSSGEVKDWADLKIQLVDEAGNNVLADGTRNADEQLTIKVEDEFEAFVGETNKYKLRFIWDDSASASLDDAGDTALVFDAATKAELPNGSGLNVTITGTQSASDQALINNNNF